MGNNQCDDCGQDFVNAETLRVHYKVTSCEKNGNSGSETSDSSHSTSSRPPQINSPVEGIEGFVVEYDHDGGFGFVRTFDMPSQGDEAHPHEIFFHVSDIGASGAREGWHLKGHVIEGEKGLKLINGEVVSKDTSQDHSSSNRSDSKRPGFGDGVDETKKRPGRKPESTADEDIEDHQDDRKFR